MTDLKVSSFVWWVLAVVGIIISFSLAYDQQYFIFAGILLVAILAIFYYKPKAGLYAMALTYPFTLLQLVYGSFNVPYVDVFALILFITLAIKQIIAMAHGQNILSKEDFPGGLLFGLFVAGAALSLLNISAADFDSSLKYLLRPIIFFYLMFVTIPVHFITSKKILLNMMRIMFGLGIVLALGGLWQFITFNPAFGLRRALPPGFGSFFPLGYNHNLLSEALIGIFPIGAAFFWLEKDIFKKNVYLVLTALIVLVAFITFSRAGWLAMIVQLFLMIFLLYRKQISRQFFRLASWLMVLMLIPFAIILYILNQTPIAQGSNFNRLKLIEIAFDMFKDFPLFGAGIGTFLRTVGEARWYIIEYGAPLDAHGVFFKVISETGIFGTLAFFAFLAFIFYKLFSAYVKVTDRTWAIILTGLIASAVGVLVFEWFGTSYYIAKMWLPFGMALAGIRLAQKSGKTLRKIAKE